MISGSPSNNTFDRREPIPGYRTTDLLGRGGYGEVWKSIAPGGISKAVKIIYGDADPTKADAELRALARIKDVRHPLLLSIERIEMCEGNLVIVTELADGSLKDRFLKLRQAQSVGVPQDELLRYISDAAEALDYLYENYSLQHLDVKPENILLLSGRAKLGDFGLVKNLYERSASLVGGLTPTYAPPELFEGKPNRHSDQYGLAIVYTHMLTGMLPFPAGSTAQLAAAHLRGVPDLAALPRAQRPVIARALSKDPTQRFPNCMALIEALRESLRAEDPASSTIGRSAHKVPVPPTPQVRAAGGPAVQSSVSKTQVVASPVAAPAAAAVPDDTKSASGHTDNATPVSHEAAPVVLIGVGGMGVEVLARLVDRLNDRYGPSKQWPAVEMIVLDSHTRSVTSRFREQDLDRVHVVPIPLKSADSFGSQTAETLKWLGRRWFYNIPRDLTTNGYRPLGRLALVSNGPRVQTALKKVIGQAAQQTSANGQAPRVTVVAAVGGGTGSGAVPDLAYAVRSELKRQGLPHERLQGVLLHATPPSHSERDKSRANAQALLRELHHYSVPGGHYPGEKHLNAAPFHGDNAAFGELLMFQLGDGLGQTDWELAVEQTAEFLYAANFTPATNHLHPQPGSAAGHDAIAPLQGHRAQIVALGAGGSTTLSDTVRTASEDVLGFWRQGRRPPTADHTSVNAKTLRLAALALPVDNDTAETDAAVQKQFQQCQFDTEHLLADATEVIELENGGSVEQFLSNLIDQAWNVVPASGSASTRAAALLAVIDRCLQSNFQEELADLGDEQLFLQIVGRLAARSSGRIKALFGWILKMVDTPDQRLDGARRNALSIQRQLQALQATALKQAATKTDASQELGNTLRSEEFHRPERRGIVSWIRPSNPDQKLRDELKAYAGIRLDEFLLRVTAKMARIVDAEVVTLVEQLDRLSRDLARLSSPIPESKQLSGADDGGSTNSSTIVLAYRNMLREQLHLHRFEIARNIDEAAQSQFVAHGKELRKYLDPVADLHQALWQPLVQLSRRSVMDCTQEINRQLLSGTRPECASMRKVLELLRDKLMTADDEPADLTTKCLVIPEGTEASALGKLSQQTKIVEGSLIDITLCVIERGVPLSDLADELTDGVEMYKDLGSRLLSRVDINWRDLDDSAQPSISQDSHDFSAQPIEPTAVLPVH